MQNSSSLEQLKQRLKRLKQLVNSDEEQAIVRDLIFEDASNPEEEEGRLLISPKITFLRVVQTAVELGLLSFQPQQNDLKFLGLQSSPYLPVEINSTSITELQALVDEMDFSSIN